MDREKILGIINKIEFRSIGGKTFHNRLTDAILTLFKDQQKQIEELKAENEFLKPFKGAFELISKSESTQILELKERVKDTTVLLRDLLEFQNGSPLIKYEIEFDKTESSCWDKVKENEQQ